MSVHKLKDGRWIVKYEKGTIKREPNRTREYFGRGVGAEKLARLRNKELGFLENTPVVQKYIDEIDRLQKDFSVFRQGIEKEVHEDLLFLLRLAAKDEKDIQEQVFTSAGFADIVTPTEIIEIKVMAEWKAAVGQLQCYALELGKKKKRLHLFERPVAKFLTKQTPPASMKTIRKICRSLEAQNMYVSFHDRHIYEKIKKQVDNVVPVFSCCTESGPNKVK